MNLRSLIAPDYGKISPNFLIIQSQWKALKWGQIQACGWMNWNSLQQKLRHIIPQIKVCQGAQNHWWWCQISCVLVRFLVLYYALLHSFKLPCALLHSVTLSCALLRYLKLLCTYFQKVLSHLPLHKTNQPQKKPSWGHNFVCIRLVFDEFCDPILQIPWICLRSIKN